MGIKVYTYETGEYEGEKTMIGWFIHDLKHWSLKVALYNLWFTISGKE